MDKTIDELDTFVKNKEIDKVKATLNDLLTRADKVVISDIGSFQTLLAYPNDTDLVRLSTQLVAELAKNEKNRKVLTNKQLVKRLLPLLDSPEQALSLQACRALGNILFENEEATKMVNKDGLESILGLIKRALDMEDTKIIATSCGCFMNLIIDSDELQKLALEHKALGVLEKMLGRNLADFEATEDCTTNALVILNMLVEHMIDEWLTPELCCVLVDVLRISMNPEISALCLEILRVQCENDDIKLCLAKKGTCELVYDLVEKHGSHVDDEESRSVLKLACDLIVLILTGDESMDLLYDSGNGKVYEQMIYWLNSEDTDLLSTGVLAIGNFARNDDHCIQMVENGLAKKLLGILKYYSSDGDTKVQHALLSTLRNLSIPAENKLKLLDENLVETLLAMLNIDHSPVEFKLLGTLRMVVDGQEKTATELIKRKDLVEKLVYWCYHSDHLGVRGEAPRLLAWLIKNCHSPDCYAPVLSIPNSVKCLVEMMSSMHVVMQNEAIFALNILCVNCLHNGDNANLLSKLLTESEIGKNMYFVIDKYNEKMELQTVENTVSLLTQLVTRKELLEDLRKANVSDALKKFLKCCTAETILKKIDQLIETFRIS